MALHARRCIRAHARPDARVHVCARTLTGADGLVRMLDCARARVGTSVVVGTCACACGYVCAWLWVRVCVAVGRSAYPSACVSLCAYACAPVRLCDETGARRRPLHWRELSPRAQRQLEGGAPEVHEMPISVRHTSDEFLDFAPPRAIKVFNSSSSLPLRRLLGVVLFCFLRASRSRHGHGSAKWSASQLVTEKKSAEHLKSVDPLARAC
eukprot:3888164-Pleurochrysis_carterae.AAC.1